MHSGPDDHDPVKATVHGSQSSPSRRELLTNAAGAVALTASGILLPHWPSDASASEETPGAERGSGRNKGSKNRHGKHSQNNKKKRGDKKDDNPRGVLMFRDVGVVIENKRRDGERLAVLQYEAGPSSFSMKYDWETIGSNGSQTYASDNSLALLAELFDPHDVNGEDMRRYVAVQNNPFFYPSVMIGWLPVNWKGSSYQLRQIYEDFLGEGTSTTREGIKVTRLPDSQTHIQFHVELI